MNWINLSTTKKDPPFNTKMLVRFKGEGFIWSTAFLEKIEVLSGGKEYLFSNGDGELTDVTHYCIPTEHKK